MLPNIIAIILLLSGGTPARHGSSFDVTVTGFVLRGGFLGGVEGLLPVQAPDGLHEKVRCGDKYTSIEGGTGDTCVSMSKPLCAWIAHHIGVMYSEKRQ